MTKLEELCKYFNVDTECTYTHLYKKCIELLDNCKSGNVFKHKEIISNYYELLELKDYYESDMLGVYLQLLRRKVRSERRSMLCEYFGLPNDFSDKDLYMASRRKKVKYHPDRPEGNMAEFMKAHANYYELKNMMNYDRKPIFNPERVLV